MNKKDVLGEIALKYFKDGKAANLSVNTSYGAPESYPVEWFFRSYEEMPELEKLALSLCKGEILDIGAGAGPHSLWLQQKGYNVTAVDNSTYFVDILLKRGIRKIIYDDIFNVEVLKYDSLFLMMNGIGFVGSIANLYELLSHLQTLLKDDGQVILDSTNISYLWEEDIPEDNYFGEVSFQFSYGDELGDWFNWLYIDSQTLSLVSRDAGWEMKVVFADEEGHYLARLTKA